MARYITRCIPLDRAVEPYDLPYGPDDKPVMAAALEWLEGPTSVSITWATTHTAYEVRKA